jgi:SAM-dependent methyltransferase
VKLTGERPIQGQSPDSLLALHDAGYREVRSRTTATRFLDLGCGLADGTSGFAAEGRTLVGVNYDPATAAEAFRLHPDIGLLTVCGDGAALPLRSGAFDDVCSSHLIEHFVDPRHHVAEVARVLADDGAAFFLTPNAPADFENPFHVSLFEADELESLLALFFTDVSIHGLEGSPELHADFAQRRASGEKLLRLDPFRLRQKVPRRWYVWAYERVLPVVYRALGSSRTGIGSGLDESHFFLTDQITPTTPGLFAVARNPRA